MAYSSVDAVSFLMIDSPPMRSAEPPSQSPPAVDSPQQQLDEPLTTAAAFAAEEGFTAPGTPTEFSEFVSAATEETDEECFRSIAADRRGSAASAESSPRAAAAAASVPSADASASVAGASRPVIAPISLSVAASHPLSALSPRVPLSYGHTQVTVSSPMHAPMSLTHVVLPPSLSPTASPALRPVTMGSPGETGDGPLDYSSQYSPSAATRRLAPALPPAAVARTDSIDRRAVHSSSPHTSADVVGAASSPAVSPAPGASPGTAHRGSFLSSLFSWGSRSATPTVQTSLPATPAPDTHAVDTSTRSESKRPSFSAGLQPTGRPISTSTSHPAGLGSLLPSTNGHVHLTPVVGSHPLQVHVLIPLTSSEHTQLLAYSVRLKTSLASHEAKISKLQSLKRRYQLARNEETAMWNQFAISSLVSIAASLYHTHLLHCSGQLQLEFGFTTELSMHLNRVQSVLDGNLALTALLAEIDDLHAAHFQEEANALKEQARLIHQQHQRAAMQDAADPESVPSPVSVGSVEDDAHRPSLLPASLLHDRMMSTIEIESLFWPVDGAMLLEQVAALGETALKLEKTYREMQRKALAQSDSKQTRTIRLRGILVKQGLESESRDRDLAREIFFLRWDEETRAAQTSFNTLMLDQRAEEGKIVARWLEETNDKVSRLQSASGALPDDGDGDVGATSTTVSPEMILDFIEFIRTDLAKRYDLSAIDRERDRQREQLLLMMQPASGDDCDEPPPSYKLVDSLSLFLHRLVFPKLSVFLSSLRSEREADLDQWFTKKIQWISKLTPAQLGLNLYFLPPTADSNATPHYQWTDEDVEDTDEWDAETITDDRPAERAATAHLPYVRAMRILHQLNLAVDNASPIDLLYYLIRTIREVTRLGNCYLGLHRELERAAQAASSHPIPTPASSETLHADNMFPIVLYVVIHAGIKQPHFLFGTLARFLPDDLRNFGTAGYALAMIESAVTHICDMARPESQATGSAITPRRRNSRLEGTPPLVTPQTQSAHASVASPRTAPISSAAQPPSASAASSMRSPPIRATSRFGGSQRSYQFDDEEEVVAVWHE